MMKKVTHYCKGTYPFKAKMKCGVYLDYVSSSHTEFVEDVTCKRCIKALDREKNYKRNKIDPLAVSLCLLFIDAIQHKPILPVTAFCIDLAKSALGWELAGDTKAARKEIRKRMDKI